MTIWTVTNKGDQECRALADKHYTRQSPGHPMWTRPGYNYVLRTEACDGVFVWWRPKWEDGRPGTSRKDGLRVLECTIFRREPSSPFLASEMIMAAVDALSWAAAASALHYDTMGALDGLISGVGSKQTARGRSKQSLPGRCFREAGWVAFEKRGSKADVWLRLDAPRLEIQHNLSRKD